MAVGCRARIVDATRKLNQSPTSSPQTILPDFQVDDCIFDIAVVPDDNSYSNYYRSVTLIKLLSPKRSLLSPDSQREIGKVTKIEVSNIETKVRWRA